MGEIKSYKLVLVTFVTICLMGILTFLLIGLSMPWSLTYLGRGYIYDNDYKYISGVNKIPPQIDSYNNSWLFITVKQFPTKLKREYPENFSDYKYKNGIETVYYWVIDKSNKHLYGPYLYDEYVYICDSLCLKASQRIK